MPKSTPITPDADHVMILTLAMVGYQPAGGKTRTQYSPAVRLPNAYPPLASVVTDASPASTTPSRSVSMKTVRPARPGSAGWNVPSEFWSCTTRPAMTPGIVRAPNRTDAVPPPVTSTGIEPAAGIGGDVRWTPGASSSRIE